MQRNEIIKKLAERIYGNANQPEIQQCTLFCDTLVDVITEALMNNERVLWKEFFTIKVCDRAERQGRNPNTNEIVTYPPTKTVVCKMSKAIKDVVKDKQNGNCKI